MKSLDFPHKLATVLCIGAHCDDIEIGCSGALLELSQRHPDAQFHWAIFAGDDVREPESKRAAAQLLGSRCSTYIQRFRGSYLKYDGEMIKNWFESTLKPIKPDLIFTHYLQDRHQDHSFLAELTWNTFRNHTILEYEIPKYEGDLANPNVYVPLSDVVATQKADMLMECFPSQHTRTWFKRDVFLAYLRLRGIECNSSSGYAEAFHGRKLTLL